ncbi:MAG: hypothetical protein EPN91_02340 [Salinibacterium sp.]|nr:MAG: hypothetical protein EPN91_02340 [Salinibacterium sp.]
MSKEHVTFWNMIKRCVAMHQPLTAEAAHDAAVRSGLLCSKRYDPDEHGELDMEPGDEFFQYTEAGTEV